MTGTIHLVYPHGSSVSTPDAIGRNLAHSLQATYRVELHDWDAAYVIKPSPGDILIGHPHPYPWTVFRRSQRVHGWSRTIVMAPFTTEPADVGFADAAVRRADAFLAITGNYWFNMLPSSALRSWAPKAVHLDLAVDRKDYPNLKHGFNLKESRKVLYIGHTAPVKNPGYLEAIRDELPGVEFGWIGAGSRRLRGFTAYGRLDLGTASARRIVEAHDVLLTVGSHDANPTTVLEAMAWGLIPVATPQSGYDNEPSIQLVPLDDASGAASILRSTLQTDEPVLAATQNTNWQRLDQHYNWTRFTRQVESAIEAGSATPSISRNWSARRSFLLGSYGPFRRAGLRLIARSLGHNQLRRLH